MGDRLSGTIADVTTPSTSRGLRLTQWEGSQPPVVLLHAGVADRRQWDTVGPHLGRTAIAYDRRGYGQAPPLPAGHHHLEDLHVLLEALNEPAWLVGNSMGGALALDAALEMPGLVAGLVLVGSAVSGLTELPGYEGTPEATAAEEALAAAEGTDRQAAAEVHYWLDGPLAPEGRVGGAVRDLALDMARGVSADEPDSGTRAWDRLAEIRVPVVVAVGEARRVSRGGGQSPTGAGPAGRPARDAARHRAPTVTRRPGEGDRARPRGAGLTERPRARRSVCPAAGRAGPAAVAELRLAEVPFHATPNCTVLSR